VSYLERPRFTFSGRFEADVSTINNNAVNFDDATFLPEYDTPGVPVVDPQGNTIGMTNGWWNPTGTGTFRLVNCRVTSAQLRSGDCQPSDAILKMKIGDAGDRAPAKIVDLDPMQQMVSTIFGLQLRLIGGNGDEDIFTGNFAPAPFTDIWFTRGGGPGSLYQSVLAGDDGGPPTWSKALGDSPFLQEFRELAGDRPLSLRFLVDAFVTKRDDQLFPTGRIIGSIGIANSSEPRHFVQGRHLFVPLDLTDPKSQSYGQPVRKDVNNAVALISGSTLLLDVGNALATKGKGGPILGKGTVKVGILSAAGEFSALGELPADYTQVGWLERTGGVVEIALGAQQAAAEASPLALSFAVAGSNAPIICPREEPGGRHVRADKFVFRADPGKTIDVDIFVSVFGHPADAEVDVALDSLDSYLNVLQPQRATPGVPGPAGRAAPLPGQPANALKFPAKIKAIAGHARLSIVASDPGNPRGYIDGQLYTVRPTLHGVPPEFVNPWDTISILLFNSVKLTGPPTWWNDVQPILQQYANLYPIMRKVLDLDDYTSVIAHKDMLAYVFSLPIENANYMPVTRDLSGGKRKLILDWLAGAHEPALGPMPPSLSAPGSKFKISLKSSNPGAPEKAAEIDGKEHARQAMMSARKPEGKSC
jgi:hypothetical protein